MAVAAGVPVKRFAEYETIYILHPGVTSETLDKVSERVSDVMKRLEGTFLRVESWGKRKLAYPIRKSTRGVFIYLRYCGPNELVAELERNLRLLEPVIRFQTVLLGKDVDPASYEVDPEDVKFMPLEVEEEEDDEEEEGLEERLGLASRAERKQERADSEDEESETASSSDNGGKSGEEEE